MKTKRAGIQNHNEHDFVFDGGLHSNSRAAIVKEILTYLLYERQQIPLPFEHIKRELKAIRETEENDTDKNGVKKRKRQINRLEVTRSINVVDNLQAISEHLTETFEVCPEIKQVLLIFGGTVISPKESYCISFPAPNLDEKILSTSVCIRSLLKQIIIQNIHEDCKTLNPTTMTILFNAPRDSNISWFLPKPNFKPPVRGKQFRFNIACKRKQNFSCPDLSRDEIDIDISGIEPLEISSMETDLDQSSQDLIFTPGGHVSVEYLQDETTPTSSSLSFDGKQDYSVKSMNSHVITSDSVDEGLSTKPLTDHIWFQAPCLVRGYRDRSSRHSSTQVM